MRTVHRPQPDTTDPVDKGPLVRRFDADVVARKTEHHPAAHRTLEEHCRLGALGAPAEIAVQAVAQRFEPFHPLRGHRRLHLAGQVDGRRTGPLREGENMEELTTAESMVMKTIWDHPHEMALQEIMKLTNETYGKDWKSQTVSTYIAKLVKKGFLRMNQSGRNATYEIIIPELSYQQEQSRKFVKFWNRGSVAQFLTAFYKDHKLTKEEIEELRKSIDELDQ